MADFTGFNPSIAQSNIREFEDVGTLIYNDLSYYNKLFIDSLAQVWFSPYAVEFGKNYTPALYDSQSQVKVLVNNTIVKCVAAYNAIATSNGYPGVPDEHVELSMENLAPNGTNMGYLDFLDISPEGVVGMDHTKAVGYLNEYNMYMQTVLTELETFPLSIAFYDPNGEILASFQAAVNKVKETLQENFTSMKTTIDSALNLEVDAVVSGAREAATKLGGQ